ncbi:MAG TPA: hypothetical protein VGG23_03760, partial [Acidimicrobiales bacterium]
MAAGSSAAASGSSVVPAGSSPARVASAAVACAVAVNALYEVRRQSVSMSRSNTAAIGIPTCG